MEDRQKKTADKYYTKFSRIKDVVLQGGHLYCINHFRTEKQTKANYFSFLKELY